MSGAAERSGTEPLEWGVVRWEDARAALTAEDLGLLQDLLARVDDFRTDLGLHALQRSVTVVDHACSGSAALNLEAAARPLMRFMCERYHPHVTAVVTPTSAELLEGLVATRQVTDYVRD